LTLQEIKAQGLTVQASWKYVGVRWARWSTWTAVSSSSHAADTHNNHSTHCNDQFPPQPGYGGPDVKPLLQQHDEGTDN